MAPIPPAVMKHVLKTFAPLLVLAAYNLPASAAVPSTFLASAFRSHCVQCHGDGGEIEGNTNLFEAIADKSAGLAPEMLEDVLAALRDQQMPPGDEPPLTEPKRSRMIAELDALLRQAVEQMPFVPTPIRRMNRFQYNNAVVDLLELDRDIFQLNERLMRRRQDYFHPETGNMPSEVRVSCRPLSKDIDNQRPEGFRGVAPFPQDKRAEHGFDNRADHLTMSPLLMESFLQLSQSIVESPDLNPKECGNWKRYFSESESEGESLQSRIAHLLRRAFRCPVDPETLHRFTHYAKTELDAGASFEQTMRTVTGAVLAMPDFLYLHEEATDRTPPLHRHRQLRSCGARRAGWGCRGACPRRPPPTCRRRRSAPSSVRTPCPLAMDCPTMRWRQPTILPLPSSAARHGVDVERAVPAAAQVVLPRPHRLDRVPR